MSSSSNGTDFVGLAYKSWTAGIFTIARWVANNVDNVAPHGHRDAHFMYVPAGNEYLTTAKGRAFRDGAHLVFNPASTYHRDRLTAPGRFLSITCSEISTDEIRLPDAPVLIGDPAARRTIHALLRTCAAWDSGAAPRMEALCYELVSMTSAGAVTEQTPPIWLNSAMKILRDLNADGISVAEVSRRVDVHPVHLARAFRNFLGHTPGDFLRSLRIERAARLLATTRRPISEIAFACGFADQSHFTRQFRRSVGVPPAAYRRLISA
jgi:AraC family transcriptional regulator